MKKPVAAILLTMLVWTASPVLATAAELLAAGLLGCISGISLYAIDPLPRNSPAVVRFLKGFGMVVLCVGISMLARALPDTHAAALHKPPCAAFVEELRTSL